VVLTWWRTAVHLGEFIAWFFLSVRSHRTWVIQTQVGISACLAQTGWSIIDRYLSFILHVIWTSRTNKHYWLILIECMLFMKWLFDFMPELLRKLYCDVKLTIVDLTGFRSSQYFIITGLLEPPDISLLLVF